MKNQYVGDVGDYGKYALLRFFLNKGIRLGVNWYLTPDIVGNKDGHKRDYLDKPVYEKIDPDFLKLMRGLQGKEDRMVSRVKELGILDGAIFYDRILDTSDRNKWDKTMFRKQWHRAALEALEECQLIFADPDNGLSPEPDDKFILPDEIEDYFTTWGHDIVYYHHRDRSPQSDWLDTISFMGKYLLQARIIALTFHPYEQRAYIFVLHEKTYEKYERLIDEFLVTNWGTIPVTSKKEPVFEKVEFEKDR